MRPQLIIIVLLLAPVAFSKTIEDRLITAEFDKAGQAHIVEEFTVSFTTTGEISDFKQLAGVNELSAWSTFLPGIGPAFFGTKMQLQVVSKIDSFGYGKVLLDYYLPEFAKATNEGGRYTTFAISPAQLTFYDAENKVLTIPAKTTLQLQALLPKAELFEVEKYVTSFPTALFLGPYVDQKAGKVTYILRGPVSASEFEFAYMIEKGIGEWDLTKIPDTIHAWIFTNPIYALVIVIIAVLIVAYRKELGGLVIDSFSGEEDLELPKKEL